MQFYIGQDQSKINAVCMSFIYGVKKKVRQIYVGCAAELPLQPLSFLFSHKDAIKSTSRSSTSQRLFLETFSAYIEENNVLQKQFSVVCMQMSCKLGFPLLCENIMAIITKTQ